MKNQKNKIARGIPKDFFCSGKPKMVYFTGVKNLFTLKIK
jgi:hypothetical protein